MLITLFCRRVYGSLPSYYFFRPDARVKILVHTIGMLNIKVIINWFIYRSFLHLTPSNSRGRSSGLLRFKGEHTNEYRTRSSHHIRSSWTQPRRRVSPCPQHIHCSTIRCLSILFFHYDLYQ